MGTAKLQGAGLPVIHPDLAPPSQPSLFVLSLPSSLSRVIEQPREGTLGTAPLLTLTRPVTYSQTDSMVPESEDAASKYTTFTRKLSCFSAFTIVI